MNNLLRPRIWPSFLASSVVGPCDVPFGYASEPIPRYRGPGARWAVHRRGLATAIHKISGLANESGVFLAGLNEVNLFNIESLVLPRVAGSSKGQSKIPLAGVSVEWLCR